jgi:hypothetical protein
MTSQTRFFHSLKRREESRTNRRKEEGGEVPEFFSMASKELFFFE